MSNYETVSLQDPRFIRFILTRRINEYLSAGGLFNPELMEHEKVRDLLMDIRDYLQGESDGCR